MFGRDIRCRSDIGLRANGDNLTPGAAGKNYEGERANYLKAGSVGRVAVLDMARL